MYELLQDFCDENEISLERDKDNADIDLIHFKDGREYKFQQPPFMDIHRAWVSEDPDQAIFELGIKNLFPITGSKDSVYIDEKYLDKNRREGFHLWSPLLRGLLTQRS